MRGGGRHRHNGSVNAQPPASDRFTDPHVSLYALAEDPIQVVCPVCQGRAEVAPWLDGKPPGRYSAGWPRRLVCRACGHVRNWPGEVADKSTCWGGPADPYFRQPLWLRAGCCKGQTLWAFNERHLDMLEGYVSARHRERGEYVGATLLTRLPAWLKAAKHRGEILRTIARLRASVSQ
jgi:hypothetical protein